MSPPSASLQTAFSFALATLAGVAFALRAQSWRVLALVAEVEA